MSVPNYGEIFLVDLPGVQSFSVTHLSAQELLDSFPEFCAFAADCEYIDCKHKKEPVCGVREAVENGQLLKTRYESYLELLEEFEKSRPY